MYQAITAGITTLFGSWVDLKKSKNEAQAAIAMKTAQAETDYDTEAQRQMQYSWKDEFITVVMFSPLVVAWFDKDRALSWVDFVSSLPHAYWYMLAGITFATFGLRWYAKKSSENS